MNNEDIKFEVVDRENGISFDVNEEGYNVSFQVSDVTFVPGEKGDPGPYYIPNVNAEGIISWTNTGDLPNPESRSIMGPQGPKGDDGQVYIHIVENPQNGNTVTITTDK